MDTWVQRLGQYKKSYQKNAFLSELTGTVNENFVMESVADLVLCPAIAGFVFWVLQEAVEQKIKRLYFLARDGYFMYLMAEKMVEKFNLPVECRYFYVSRYSLRVPMFHMDTETALEYITLGGLDVSLEKVFLRAGFNEKLIQELKDEFPEYPLKEQIPRQNLSALKEQMRGNQAFMESLIQNSKAELPGLKNYLEQEGLMDGCRMAIVDSGWVGSMQKQLNALRTFLGATNILTGYYWGLYETPKGCNRQEYHSYYFAPENQVRRKVYFSNCLFEGVFSAPHGMTLSYDKQPILAPIAPEKKKFLQSVESNMVRFTDKFLKKLGDCTFEQAIERMTVSYLKTATQRNLSLFMTFPTQEEAALFGKLPFTDDVLEYAGRQLAEPMDEQELTDNHLVNRIKQMVLAPQVTVKQSAWYEGSVMASEANVNDRRRKQHLRSYVRYKYFLNYRKMAMWRRNNG